MAKLLKVRFWTFFVLPQAFFLCGVLLLSPEPMISWLNAALTSLSVGVVVAYHKPVGEILFGDGRLDREDWLALGIFLSWFGGIVVRGHSMVWRILGRPDDLENTYILAYGLFQLCISAVCHLAAGSALADNRIPPVRWIKIGVIAAAGVFTLFAVAFATR
jgi:hypothetical protein